MNIKNRTPDVVGLRCHICQKFLKLVAKENWKEILYLFLQNEVKGRYKDNYYEQYKIIRKNGIDNYSIDDMDVPFIVNILRFCPSIASITKDTQNDLNSLREDRHTTNHSSDNESDEELYLRALISLKNMQNFLHTVDKNEMSIPDEQRYQFLMDYTKRINELKIQIYNDCIETFQIKKDIQTILASDNPSKAFLYVYRAYDDKIRALRTDDSKMQLWQFCIESSNAGIQEAHSYASMVFEYYLHDYDEATHRLELMATGCEKLEPYEMERIINFVNFVNDRGIPLTNEMRQLVQIVKNQKFDITETDKGIIWNKRKQ